MPASDLTTATSDAMISLVLSADGPVAVEELRRIIRNGLPASRPDTDVALARPISAPLVTLLMKTGVTTGYWD